MFLTRFVTNLTERRRVNGRGLVAWLLIGGVGLVVACGEERKTQTEASPIKETVQIVTPYAAGDAPGFSASFDDLREAIGLHVDVRAESGNLVDTVVLRVAANDPPDLVVVPQPGVVKDLYELGRVKPIPERVRAKIVGQHPPGLTGLSTVDDHLVSVWAQTSSSLMWYRADLFEAKGWSVPTTAEGFDKLVATIAAEGTYAPFCAGIEAKGATGWYMTDWLENLLLTRRGADFYDRWATHQIPFNSPEVVEELRRMQGWLADPKFTYGSPDKVLATSVEEGFAGLADDPANCAMAFNSQWVFATIQPAIDAGRVVVADPADGAPVSSKPTLSAFRLPSAVGQPPALVLGGDQLVALSDRPEVWQVMEYVASRDWGVPWAKMGGYISPHEDFDTAVYKDVPSKVIADAIHHTEVQRFDGTDGMPTEVGSGSVWTGMVDLLAGVDPQTVADAIEDSWRNVRQTGG